MDSITLNVYNDLFIQLPVFEHLAYFLFSLLQIVLQDYVFI
jgi:hypothetical protein